MKKEPLIIQQIKSTEFANNGRESDRFTLTQYNGKPFFGLTKWWKNGNGEWCPSKGKHYNIRLENWDNFLKALNLTTADIEKILGKTSADNSSMH